ncbi:putative AC transposase [Purpureocillium lavendulum]|uniref:AC transposase n=1 Tax=Purpureocillium lavendulum TaxID=1247861 RepID=A0AB34FGB2_9HYPO|nr:putative AC transposase [Purpureocillium lavendulum]
MNCRAPPTQPGPRADSPDWVVDDAELQKELAAETLNAETADSDGTLGTSEFDDLADTVWGAEALTGETLDSSGNIAPLDRGFDTLWGSAALTWKTLGSSGDIEASDIDDFDTLWETKALSAQTFGSNGNEASQFEDHETLPADVEAPLTLETLEASGNVDVSGPSLDTGPAPPPVFSIQEAIAAAETADCVDLFARVVYSVRENFGRKQHFQFSDLFGGPAFLGGTLAN